MGNFKKLLVWQKAKNLAIKIYKLTAELRTQLIISMEVGYINSDTFKELEKDCDEISAMLTNLIKHRSK